VSKYGISFSAQIISLVVSLVTLPEVAVLDTTAETKPYENVVDATDVTINVPLNVASTPVTLTVLPTVKA
jgi:hypothetical protein